MTCYNCKKVIVDRSRYCYLCGAAQQTFTPPPPPRYDPGKPLRRSRSDKVIGGVCAGFAGHFGWDITLVRIIWVLLAIFASGAGFIAYVVCWIVIPQEEIDVPVSPPTTPQSSG